MKVSSHTPLHNEQAEECAQIIREIPLRDPVRPISILPPNATPEAAT